MTLFADDALGRIGWLAEAVPHFREAMLARAQPHHFEHGQVMWQAALPGNGLIGIQSGAAGLLHALAPPESPILDIVGPGFWAGQAPFLTRAAVQMTLIARGPVEAVIVPRSVMLALLGERGDYWRELGRLSLEQAFLATVAMGDLLIPNSRRRLAGTLLRLAQCRRAGEPQCVIMISQTELAAMTNLSRHSAGPLLAGFARAGLIDLGYRSIGIADVTGLRAVADTD
jgi:CRP-like cAMP-binding protein